MCRDFTALLARLLIVAALLLLLVIVAPMALRRVSQASTEAGTHVSCPRLALCATPTPRR